MNKLGDVWTVLSTGKLPPSRKTRKVELVNSGDFMREDLRALMRARPARWWELYVYAKDSHVVVQFWNKRYEG